MVLSSAGNGGGGGKLSAIYLTPLMDVLLTQYLLEPTNASPLKVGKDWTVEASEYDFLRIQKRF
jgi:hypothetical protein